MPTINDALAVLSALIGGVMNSIAGGGTLVTFPALIALGVPPINANATSTVALWPGAAGSMWGYRSELRGSSAWALGFALPSLLGGGLGAWLLLQTPPEQFSAIVPWLVLGATLLFVAQERLLASFQLKKGMTPDPDAALDAALTSRRAPWSVLFYQFLVSIYGGYFGAGVGILMLAALGFMGLSNIHRMNGLKNWGGLCMNAVAAAMFAFSSLVSWRVALAMAGGAICGGYLGSRTAQRVPQRLVRGSIVAIGLISGVLLLLSR
ncbi:MAG TPA: sulfite exporter TauE/SafE family protein [Gemmatimonadaceae bacterium]|nr:sulfite exporter TauE/SafE family protein [Gemmatimonadaceae bacterium]